MWRASCGALAVTRQEHVHRVNASSANGGALSCGESKFKGKARPIKGRDLFLAMYFLLPLVRLHC